MHKGMLPTDDMTGWPPGLHIGVNRLGGQDIAKAPMAVRVLIVEVLQLVETFEVEEQASIAAIDLNLEEVLPAVRHASRFKTAERSIFKPGKKQRGVIHVHFGFRAGTVWQGTLLDEGFLDSGDFLDIAQEIMGQVNQVGVQVAMWTGAGFGFLESPDTRKIRIHNPVLEINRPPVHDASQSSLFNHPVCQHQRRNSPIVECHHVAHSGGFDRLKHFDRLFEVICQRLFAQNVLSCFGGGDGDGMMQVARRGNIHQINILALNHLAPIVGCFLPAILPGGGFHGLAIAPTENFHARFGNFREKHGHFPKSMTMRFSHELIADQGNVQGWFHPSSPGERPTESPGGVSLRLTGCYDYPRLEPECQFRKGDFCLVFRVLLIQPPVHDFSAFDLWTRPLAWLKLAAHLERLGVEVQLVDALDRSHPLVENLPQRRHRNNHFGCGHYLQEEIEKPRLLKAIPRKYSRFGLPLPLLRSLLADRQRPDVVVTGCTMTYWYPGLQEAIREVRALWGSVPVVAAGIYAILCPQHARKTSGADHVYSGHSYNELIQFLFSCSGKSVPENLPEDTAFIPPAFHLLSQQKSLPLQTSSGCVFRCTYCASHLLNPFFVQYPVTALIGYLEECQAKYQTTDWALYDDALLVNAENHIIPLLEAILRKELRFRFHTPNALHCRMMDRRLAELMKACGFETIRLGVEFSREERQRMTGGKVLQEDFVNAMRHLHTAGFSSSQIGAYLLAAYPGQSPSEVLEGCRQVYEQGCLIKLALYAPIPRTRDYDKDYTDWRFHPDDDPLYQNCSLAPFRSSAFTFEDYQHIKQQVNAWNLALSGVSGDEVHSGQS